MLYLLNHLSIGRPTDLCLDLSKEAEDKSMYICEQSNDLDITVDSAFTPLANVLTGTNKAR